MNNTLARADVTRVGDLVGMGGGWDFRKVLEIVKGRGLTLRMTVLEKLVQ